MSLEDVLDGTRVMVDANIAIYHFTGVSRQCRDFIARCQRRAIAALMPVHTALEVLHRLMTIEAVQAGAVKSKDVVKKLAFSPAVVRQLTTCYADLQFLPRLGIDIVDSTHDALVRVPALCLAHGLLANDAALLAEMETRGVSLLASADQHFNRVQHISTCSPSDLRP